MALWIDIRAIFGALKFVVGNLEGSLLFGHKFLIIRYRTILNHDNFTETETNQEMMMRIFERLIADRVVIFQIDFIEKSIIDERFQLALHRRKQYRMVDFMKLNKHLIGGNKWGAHFYKSFKFPLDAESLKFHLFKEIF